MDHVLRSSGYKLYKKDIVRGKGCYLYDGQNNRYIDFESGVWCAALGHNHERINHVIIEQMEQISHLGYRYTNPIVDEAAEQVLETVHFSNGKCIFLSSGSEAVEFGVQITRRLTGKPLLLTLSDSYLAAYGSAGRKTQEEWYCFDWSVCTACPQLDQCDPKCEHLRDIPFERIGGLVFEPGNASGRVKLPPQQLIQTLERMVKQVHGLIVVNEVTTGIGRTGAWYGFEHYALKPDLIAIGKGIGNGYPVSAVVMTKEIAEQLKKSRFGYAQSHQNDAWGCAVAKEVVSVIQEDRLIKRSHDVGLEFLNQLEQLKEKHDRIKEVRGRGLMIAIEFHGDDEHFSLASVHRELFKRGFLVGYSPVANFFRFYPPLIIKEGDIENMVESIDQILREKN